MREPKKKVEREIHMNWGGNIPHMVEDSDVFNKMPAWRQAEMRETAMIVRDYPGCVAYATIDWKTMKPRTDQLLIEDIRKKLRASRQSLPEVPAGYKFNVPNGVPRGVFAYLKSAPPPTDEQAYILLLSLERFVTEEKLIETCTYEKRLLSDKPLHGVMAFIWRLARYMSGAEESIPATAFVDLIDGVSSITVLDNRTQTEKHLRVDPAKVITIMQFLESKARQLVDIVGEDRHAGDLRWARAVGAAK